MISEDFIPISKAVREFNKRKKNDLTVSEFLQKLCEKKIEREVYCWVSGLPLKRLKYKGGECYVEIVCYEGFVGLTSGEQNDFLSSLANGVAPTGIKWVEIQGEQLRVANIESLKKAIGGSCWDLEAYSKVEAFEDKEVDEGDFVPTVDSLRLTVASFEVEFFSVRGENITSIDEDIVESQEQEIIHNTPKGKRTSELHEVIMRVDKYLSDLEKYKNNKPSARDVLNKFRLDYDSFDEKGVIKEVSDDDILWLSTNGNSQKLLLTSFPSTLSKIRSKYNS